MRSYEESRTIAPLNHFSPFVHFVGFVVLLHGNG
jgi:hypothetical protein